MTSPYGGGFGAYQPGGGLGAGTPLEAPARPDLSSAAIDTEARR